MEAEYTRPEVDLMALDFLNRVGPHTMGPINSEEELAAALVFIDLEKRGFVHRSVITQGWIQFTITQDGEKQLAERETN